jgi:hypothetical protein
MSQIGYCGGFSPMLSIQGQFTVVWLEISERFTRTARQFACRRGNFHEGLEKVPATLHRTGLDVVAFHARLSYDSAFDDTFKPGHPYCAPQDLRRSSGERQAA